MQIAVYSGGVELAGVRHGDEEVDNYETDEKICPGFDCGSPACGAAPHGGRESGAAYHGGKFRL